jgi:hypothetical protein
VTVGVLGVDTAGVGTTAGVGVGVWIAGVTAGPVEVMDGIAGITDEIVGSTLFVRVLTTAGIAVVTVVNVGVTVSD